MSEAADAFKGEASGGLGKTVVPAIDDRARREMSAALFAEETRLVASLVDRAAPSHQERGRIDALARSLVEAARAGRRDYGGVDAFMHEYGLSTEEGTILMCLAEALLRIPDRATASALIADRLADGDWARHLGHSDSLFVNASTFGLMLSGSVVGLSEGANDGPFGVLKRLIARSGQPVIREAMRQAMRILGDQFVLAPTIEQALGRARTWESKGYRMSYDMLGEGALTDADAERYAVRYAHAIEMVGQAAGRRATGFEGLMARPGLSIKLSALYPRFEASQADRARAALGERLLVLLERAKHYELPITIDAEEASRLELSLTVFADAARHPAIAPWHGLGLAVQTYGRRALPVLRWLRQLASETRRRIPVRLVKGAYWDSEIKWAQEQGLPDYPVFSRKAHTDISYLACMRMLLAEGEAFYPQFATHNAHTVASAHVAGAWQTFEMQRLHGMGQAIYAEVVDPAKLNRPCRIYAPVGEHKDLLPYLVRRLLENGANASFVNRLADDEVPVESIVRDPVEIVTATATRPDATPPLAGPARIFLPERRNSAGVALWDSTTRRDLEHEIEEALAEPIEAAPIIGGSGRLGGARERTTVLSPHDRRVRVGFVTLAGPADIEDAIVQAASAQAIWDRRGGAGRADILLKAADLFELYRPRLMAAMIREAGKTVAAALGDLREAVDYLRYYAGEARKHCAGPIVLPGVTGERNLLSLHGRGIFACISPWNFPLAIFTGQVAAALAAGNAVVAKPAEQTPLTAFLAVRLLHEAGVPGDVLHLLPGDGPSVGARLVADKRIGGIVFTGSNATAWAIQKALTERRGAIVPFIAETGGINAMLADSSALTEQVVRDCLASAFDSAGQRCSAARVLLIQTDVADPTIEMLVGAARTLVIGDPLDYETDIGPVIDEDARDDLLAHKLAMRRRARELLDMPVPAALSRGTYVGPAIYEVESFASVEREVFGPILHVVRYEARNLDAVIDTINAAGYGLTLGLHSRIESVHERVAARARVGNLYINRNQIGAVVGSQPFGGEGLSGTGPKGGGPYTLARFAVERVVTTNLTAMGGNAVLLGRE